MHCNGNGDYFDEIFETSCGNFRGSRWRKFCANDDTSISVYWADGWMNVLDVLWVPVWDPIQVFILVIYDCWIRLSPATCTQTCLSTSRKPRTLVCTLLTKVYVMYVEFRWIIWFSVSLCCSKDCTWNTGNINLSGKLWKINNVYEVYEVSILLMFTKLAALLFFLTSYRWVSARKTQLHC